MTFRNSIANALRERASILTRGVGVMLASATAFAAIAAPAPALASVARTDIVAGSPLAAGKVAAKAAPDIDAAGGILMNAEGDVLWARDPKGRRAMASTTKMMTALITVEQGGLDDYVTVSKAAANTEYGIGLPAGARLTKRHLLELAMVASSNDAAYALGEHAGGGSMKTFVRLMNSRARTLGMTDTSFANPHGLDARGHYSSPADLAKLAQELMKHPEARRATGMRKVTAPTTSGKRALAATDELLGRYQGLRGVKTGYTGAAKFSFVGQAQRGDLTLTAVVLGTPTNASRFAETAQLLDWGFKHTQTLRLTSAGEPVGSVPLAADPSRKVPARLAETTTARIFTLAGPVRREPSLAPHVALPVFEGQRLGRVLVKQGDRVLATVPAVAAAQAASVDETVGSVPVADYLDRAIVARAGDATAVAKFDPDRPVRRRVLLRDKVDAPVERGDRLGEIVYSQDGRVVASVPAVAASGAERPEPLERVRISVVRVWRGLTGGRQAASLKLADVEA